VWLAHSRTPAGQRAEADPVQHGGGPVLDLRAGQLAAAQRERHVVPHGQSVHYKSNHCYC